jgi:hypothetical protein
MTNSRPSSARPEMREELPMNYIDLLKRVAIPLGTIMVLSSALAQEQLTKADLVQLAVTLGSTTIVAKTSLPGCWPMYSAWSECSIRTT